MIKMKTPGYEDYFKSRGLKKTKHRIAVVDTLERKNGPISAEEIFFDLKELDYPINLSTVYRTLELLVSKNLVNKLNLSVNSKALYEMNCLTHKHYLVCLGCKKILAIEHCPLHDYEKILEKEMNYTIAGHKLDIYGYCPDCQITR